MLRLFYTNPKTHQQNVNMWKVIDVKEGDNSPC